MADIELQTDPEDHRLAMALFRYSLVGSLVELALDQGCLTVELRRITARRHKIPGSGRTRVSQTSLRRWLEAFRQGGLEALKPALRRDHGTSRAIPKEWLDRALALRKELPSRTAGVIVEILQTQPGCPPLHRRTLDSAFRRLNLTRRVLRKPTSRTKRWGVDHVNDLWQGDASDGVWLPDPQIPGKNVQTTLFLWIDDYSRLVTHAEFFLDEKLPRMERTLRQAVLARGVPRRIYTDNGNVYVANQFKAALIELGIEGVRARVRRPQGKGKVERVFRTLQQDFYPEVQQASITTLADLNAALWAWLERVYHRRVHTQTKKAPLELYREGLASVRQADAEKVARAFLWRYQRRVSSNGYISLLSNTYSVDPSWATRTIDLRLDPFDLSRIEVYQDGRPVARAQLRNLKRARCLELEPTVPPLDLAPSGIRYLETLRREHDARVAAELGGLSYRRALQPREGEQR